MELSEGREVGGGPAAGLVADEANEGDEDEFDEDVAFVPTAFSFNSTEDIDLSLVFKTGGESLLLFALLCAPSSCLLCQTVDVVADSVSFLGCCLCTAAWIWEMRLLCVKELAKEDTFEPAGG